MGDKIAGNYIFVVLFHHVTPATLGSRILVMTKYIQIILKPRE
jgi:hypothetical protein